MRHYSDSVPIVKLAVPVNAATASLILNITLTPYLPLFPFVLRLDADDVNEELVLVNSGSGTLADPYMVTRGYGTTPAMSHAINANVQHAVMSADFQDSRNHEVLTGTAHGGFAPVANVRSFGALGDGSTDDTTAIAAAVTSLGSNGGVVHFPPGNYVATAISVPSSRSITLSGPSGRTAGSLPAARITFNGTGSGTFIDAKYSAGFTIRDLQIYSSSASFTGRLIDIRNISAGDPAYILLQNLSILGTGQSCTLLDLDKATRVRVISCAFYSGAVCISGKSVNTNYSNQISIVDCGFNTSTKSINNPGQAWSIQACCFEGGPTGVASSVSHDAGVLCEGLLITGCWSGDTTSGTVYQVAGEGISILANYVGATGGIGVSVDEVSEGVTILNNRFAGCTTAVAYLSSGSQKGAFIWGNSYTGVTNKLTGAQAPGSVYNVDFTTTLYGFTSNGDMTLVDGNNISVGNATGTKLGTSTSAKLGFMGATPVTRQTLPSSGTVTAADIRAALITLGLCV